MIKDGASHLYPTYKSYSDVFIKLFLCSQAEVNKICGKFLSFIFENGNQASYISLYKPSW